jgi:hypothetical protein
MAKSFETVIQSIEKRIKKETSAMVREIVKGTPLRTGNARSNWNVNIGSVDETIRKPYYDYLKITGKRGKFSERRNLTPTVLAADAVIDVWDVKRDERLFISNNVSYISGLESGVSSQNSGFINNATSTFMGKFK